MQDHCSSRKARRGEGLRRLGALFALILVLFAAHTAGAETMDELRKRIDEKESEIKALEEEAAQYRRNLNQTMLQSKTLSGEVSRLDAAIKQINYRLSIVRHQLDATVLKIRTLNNKISASELSINQRRAQISEIIRTLNDFDQLGLLPMALNSRGVIEFFDAVASLTQLEKGLYNELLTIKAFKEDLEVNRQQEKNLEIEQRALNEELTTQNIIEQSKRKDRANLLAQTRNQESRYQQLLAENRKRQEEIAREIEGLESELRRLILKANIPPRTPGLFSWPVDNGYVTQEYGETTKTGFINDFYKFHNGIDFGASGGIGVPIKAVADGVVTAVGDTSPYAYGKWVAIDHGNGLTTLYAHFSLVAVGRGRGVSRGSVIGYMGSTGFVTGPHLHLTVYATETFRVEKRWFGLLPLGGSLNPRDYLPAS